MAECAECDQRPFGLRRRHLFDDDLPVRPLFDEFVAGDAWKLSDSTFSTARTYLDRIYRKTGTNHQSQLVSLLKSVGPFKP